MSNYDATAVFQSRFLGTAGRQYVLVAGPSRVVGDREWVRLRLPGGVFPARGAGTILQWVALRSRFAFHAQESSETDGFGQLPEQRMDDG